MAKKDFWGCTVFAVLVGVLAFTGCPNDTSQTKEDLRIEEDTWTKVSSADELAGTWEGSGTFTMPKQQTTFGMGFTEGAEDAEDTEDAGDEEGAFALSMRACKVPYTMNLKYTAGVEAADLKVKTDISDYLDAFVEAVKADIQLSLVLAYMGMPVTKGGFFEMMAEKGEGKYYTINSNTIPKGKLVSEEQPVYINQYKTKIKLVQPKGTAYGEITLDQDQETILIKK